MLNVVGDRVLILPDDLQREHNGILISYGEDEKAHKMASQKGTVIGIGPEAWSDYETKWCKVGDKVIFAQYAGKFVTDPDTKIDYIVVNDIDVQVVIEETNKDG